MAKIHRQGNLKEEIQKQYDYKINKEKHEQILKDFAHIAAASRYRTHLKIAVQEHAKFINQLPQETKGLITPPKDPRKAFLVLRGDTWEPNLKFVTQCINASLKTGQTLTFEFFNSNIVLDKLIDKLKNRDKSNESHAR